MFLQPFQDLRIVQIYFARKRQNHQLGQVKALHIAAIRQPALLEHVENDAQLAQADRAALDGAEPLLLMLGAEDGQAFIQHASGDPSPLYLKLGVDRLLPKLQFVYDI